MKKSEITLVKFRRRDSNEIVEFPCATWAVQQIKRETGLVEDICEHGVGHPNKGCMDYIDALNLGDWWGVHGCDGCCSK